MERRSWLNLDGKTVIVTGGASGIGRAVAQELLWDGANVAVCDCSTQEPAFETGAGRCLYVSADVTDPESISDMVEKVKSMLGTIYGLVNNAGIIKRIPALEMSLTDWQQVICTDLTGPFLMSKIVAKGMKERGGGKIINMCSMMSEVGRDTVSAYAAAKGGLKMLTKNLATEWARYHIQVNGIGPGYFATSQTAPIRVNGHPFHEFILKRTPAGRWGNPEDLAGTAIFLASPASDFVTGQVVYVDGGILASLGKAANED